MITKGAQHKLHFISPKGKNTIAQGNALGAGIKKCLKP